MNKNYWTALNVSRWLVLKKGIIILFIITLIGIFSTKEKDILISRFIVGKTQMEIADSMGISQAQVSRIEKNAIENVRKLIK